MRLISQLAKSTKKKKQKKSTKKEKAAAAEGGDKISTDADQFGAGAGASLSYPMQASALRKGGYVLIKGFPCKIMDMSTSKTGKHGHAKVHFVAIDIFSGKKREEIIASSHNMDVPNVARDEYTLVDVNAGFLTLLLPSGELKEDVKVPEGELGDRIGSMHKEGKEVLVSVLKSMNQEMAIEVKEAPKDKKA